MGVNGLWKLIEPAGKQVPVETLEGKVLAVDISIWLHQVVKGFQDNKGSALPNAHILGLFHRLCKLLYYRVRPVFVFDGCVPQLKRDTIARRQQQRSKLNSEAERIQALVLQSLAKEKVVQQALGVTATELLLKSAAKHGGGKSASDPDELFKLPELPLSATKADDESDIANDSSFETSYTSATASSSDSSFDESNPRHAYNNNLQAIDVRSQHFRQLPADVRHEILVDIKETRKQSSWGRLHELPARSDDFSAFQMKRLLKRRAVQESLEEAEQEMGGRTLTYAELKNMFTEEGIVEPTAFEQASKQICSDENTRFLLVRDLKKKLAKVEEIKEKPDENSKADNLEIRDEIIAKEKFDDEQPSTSSASKVARSPPLPPKAVEFGTEYDADLAMAIALSLEENGGGGAADDAVYCERDYQYEECAQLKLNRAQRKQLEGAATGPARAYMIEYGGMNEDEVVGIMDATQVHKDDVDNSMEGGDESYAGLIAAYQSDDKMQAVQQKDESFKLHVSDSDETDSDFELVEPTESTISEKTTQPESQELRLCVSDATDTDSDLEEVGVPTLKIKKAPLEIVIDLKESQTLPEDDMFADIFEDKGDNDNENKRLNALKDKEHIITIESQSNAEDVQVTNVPKFNQSSTQQLQLSILDELKKQVEDVKKINLDDIKVNASIIEILDSEEFLTKEASPPPTTTATANKAEIIEICDSDDQEQKRINILASPTSRLPKTPSKSKSISEYFDMNYVIKRTPESSKKEKDGEDEAVVPKIKSPFFVNRTPKSGHKRSARDSDSPTHSKRVSKATKSLFEKNASNKEEAALESGIEPIIDTEDIVKEAATLLKKQNTDQQLHAIATNLAKERKDLENERNRQDRMGMSISQRMNSECQELLRLFGVPFIVAPMEAEAQCAFLDAVTLTNGTITDDSDIWLFGGRTVYKNFFAQNKDVMEFRAEQIEKSFSCDRRKLIQLACLVGSDYTTGIHGIGAVTALEILASFSDTASTSSSVAAEDVASNVQNTTTVITTLSKFRDWCSANKTSAKPPGSSARLALQKKLKNIELHDGFPSAAVVDAYLTPKVDDSTEALTWGQPDVESIREFTRKTFGWTTSKTDDILNPVIKKINEKKSQATIRNYFSVKSTLSVAQKHVSKRVQGAIDRMSGKVAETPEKAPKTKAKRGTRKRKQKTTTETADEKPIADQNDLEAPTSSSAASQPGAPKAKKTAAANANIPNTKEVIPQREVARKKIQQNKERAAAVLRSSAVVSKKKRNS